MSFRREPSPMRGRSPPRGGQWDPNAPRGAPPSDYPPPPRYDRSPSPYRRGYSPDRRYRSPPRGRFEPYYENRGYDSRPPPRGPYRDYPPPPRRERRRSPPRLTDAQREASTTLFVGNLPYDWKAEDCVRYCEQWGTVESVNVGFNRRTNMSKGYAFVQFERKQDAEEAFRVMKNGAMVGGRNVRVDWDIGYDRKHRSPPRGDGVSNGVPGMDYDMRERRGMDYPPPAGGDFGRGEGSFNREGPPSSIEYRRPPSPGAPGSYSSQQDQQRN